MGIKLMTPLYNFNGVALQDGSGDLLLRSVLLVALSQGENKESTYAQKAAQFSLGVRIAACEKSEMTFSAEEIELLKNLVAARFTPIVVGQVGALLEGRDIGFPIQMKKEEV